MRRSVFARMARIAAISAFACSLSAAQLATKDDHYRAPPKDDRYPAYPAAAEILTPLDGVDFRKFTQRLEPDVKRNWHAVIPEEAKAGDKGKVVLRFKI